MQVQRREPIGVKGFTHSEFRPTAFWGFWWDAGRRRWIKDKILLVMVDYRLSFNDERLSVKVEELKRVIRKWYRRYGSPRDEVWVVAQQVIRQD